MKHLSLDRFFDLVLSGSSEGAMKPEQIREVARKWNIGPHEIGYIGDMPYDMRAAKEVGAIPLGAAWDECIEYDEMKRLSYALFTTIDSFREWIVSGLL